ncbi:uncharacterized protein K452DRAFT_290114 [Aplosporella prunicola CBS 121167]|uniref:DUF7962 domain-containing protein n=1 Tax=Aplosporella prunicola CBS 121167 TaxID=1176127 RepID=A0A6A6B7V3_9PEZI|nr:uncharacterized protein K452DRAFT_290114 [Aplosporella prunicola CBS 121167]KAF2139017.1 hypothetical protein K452DRAFT_290114 [Aplosporella prunicola CBS 121167]
MAIGGHVYCDTRLILRKLEQRFPDGAIGASGGDQKAIESLLSRWTIDGGIFARAASLIPPDMPVLQDPKFLEDRKSFSGRSWDKEDLRRGRPESMVHIRDAFALLESTLLADGRDWILKTERPSLADIEAIWPLDWLVEMKGALPPALISESSFPKVFAWIKRFRDALKAAKSSGFKGVTLDGPAAVKAVTGGRGGDGEDTEGRFDSAEPSGVQQGEEVEVWPIESGFSHRDRGRLVSLTFDEVVLELETGVRIHFPRWGFRVSKAAAPAAARL